MGQFLNPGKMNYMMAVNSKIFIDKSGMIGSLTVLSIRSSGMSAFPALADLERLWLQT